MPLQLQDSPAIRITLAGAAMAALLAACDNSTVDDLQRVTDDGSHASGPSANRAREAEESRGPRAPGIVARQPSEQYRRRSEDRERYQHTEDNPLRRTDEHPVSTFSVDVDTGSYANVRRFLRSGRLPPGDAVRVEEMVNYFDYDYAAPEDRTRPFRVSTEVARTPWNEQTYLLRVGIRGYDIERSERPAANLVFLVDVSGSMNDPAKLPLVIASLRMLTQQLAARDRISIVVYAGRSGVVLEPTPGNDKDRIIAALERLRAGGSTAGASGIRLAYSMARQAFIEEGINRVILATDGDFNVGVTDNDALQDMVERNRESGITLTTLGFGTGNYNEHLMERIADIGNGNYAYIDTVEEARRVLVQEMSSTLFTIAQDVKVQLEFNPRVIAEYRLVGYENRMLRREDFRNDRVDAGDIGAGHTVTALYEVTLVGSDGRRIRDLRYGGRNADGGEERGEFAHLRLRYKLPGESESRLIERPLMTRAIERADGYGGADMRFAAAVAAYGQLLRGGRYMEEFGFGDVRRLARRGVGDDPGGYRAGFLRLVDLAETLSPRRHTARRGAE